MPDTKYRETEQDTENNIAEKISARDLGSLDQYDAEMRDYLNDSEKNASEAGKSDANPNKVSVGDKEREAGMDANRRFFNNNQPSFDASGVSKGDAKTKTKASLPQIVKGLRSPRTAAMITIFGVFGGIVVSVMFMLLPLKLEAMIQTAMDKFGAVPEHAVQQRMEYLTTRWIATRAMQVANPEANLVFCAGGGILCHLGNTKYNEWFEKKLDAKFEKSGQKVKATLNTSGRTSLGGKATTIELSFEELGDHESALKGVTREINHKEARAILKQQARTVHGRNFIMRFISKGNLMRKYGIKRFSIIPDKVAKKITDFTAKMKAKMLKNTLGKISTRMASYMGCLSGGDTALCEKTLKELSDSLSSDVDKAQKSLDSIDGDADPEAKQHAQEKLDGKKQKENIFKGLDADIDSKTTGRLSKIMANKVVTNIMAGAAVFGIVDLAASIVTGINTLPFIRYDLALSTYMSFAYDEDYGPIVTNDLMKLGNTDVMMHLQAVTGMFDGAEKSPLYSAMNGLPTSSSAGGGVVTECEDGEDLKPTALDPGELVCPEQKLVTDVGGFLRNKPWWPSITTLANSWNSTGGKIFRLRDKVTGAIFDHTFGALGGWLTDHIPGIKSINEKIGDYTSDVIKTALISPSVGPTSTGSQNYVGTTFALQSTMNSGMEYGQKNSSGLMGGGGVPLGDTTVSQILQETRDQDYDEFQSKTMWAKLSDTTSEFSIGYKLLAQMPTSKSSALSFLLNTPSTILSSLTTRPASAEENSESDLSVLKASGLPIYGFASNDSAIEADPAIYTPEFCEASAKAREDSYSDKNGYLIPTYAKTDPCALERVIGGVMAEDIGDKSDPNYIPEPDSAAAGNTGGGSSVHGVGDNIDDIVMYFQGESPWADQMYGPCTIAEAGCGPTTLASIVSTLHKDSPVNPKEMADFFVSVGAQGTGDYCGSVQSAWTREQSPASTKQFEDKFHIKIDEVPASEENVNRGLAEGGLVMANVKGSTIFTSSGHFLFIRGKSGDNFLVGDPADRSKTTNGEGYAPSIFQFGTGTPQIWIVKKA